MLTDLLRKKNITSNFHASKDKYLFKSKPVGGRVLRVQFEKLSTKFDITDFVRVSKKHGQTLSIN